MGTAARRRAHRGRAGWSSTRTPTRSSPQSARLVGGGAAMGSAAGAVPALTKAKGDDAGAHSTLVWSARSWRPIRPGWPAAITGWSWPRCRGRGTTAGSPARLRTPRRRDVPARSPTAQIQRRAVHPRPGASTPDPVTNYRDVIRGCEGKGGIMGNAQVEATVDPEQAHDPSRFSRASFGLSDGRLLPICCRCRARERPGNGLLLAVLLVSTVGLVLFNNDPNTTPLQIQNLACDQQEPL